LIYLPLVSCTKDGKNGYKYGEGNTSCFTYEEGNEESRKLAKRQAIIQATAIANSTGEKLDLSKEDIEEVCKDFNVELQEDMIKYDDEHNCIFGWGYVAIRKDNSQVYDHSTEYVAEEDYKDLELGIYAYNLEFRASDIGHVEKQTGYLIESFVVTKEKLKKMGLPENALPLGVWCGYFFPNDEDYAKIKKMRHPMFSLFGSAKKEYIKEEDR
jgi:hypothetical protein